jgi:omega-amidase
MKRFVVCGIQMDVKPSDVDHNLKTAVRLTEQSLKFAPNLIVFPEMFATGFAYKYLEKIAKEFFDDLAAFMMNMAAKTGAYVVGGSIPELHEGKLYNTSLLASPDRKILGLYRKIHPFTLTEEAKYFAGGNHISIIDTPLAKIGINICYDIRFPEIARKQTLSGMELLIVPSQFPHPRLHHWEALLKSRAIENQIYVVGVNRMGGHNPKYFGHSMVIDPYGEVLDSSADKEDILVSEINLERIMEVRKAMPVLLDRRPEVYDQ